MFPIIGGYPRIGQIPDGAPKFDQMLNVWCTQIWLVLNLKSSTTMQIMIYKQSLTNNTAYTEGKYL